MDFSIFYQLKNKKIRWMDDIYYFVMALFIASVFCYGIFMYKNYLQQQKISDLNQKMLLYSTPAQKALDQQILDYKKKIDDFSLLVNNHRVSINLFNFIEKNTLSNVWLSTFNVSETKDVVSLSGQAQDMATLSNQVKILEENKDYIQSISVLNSQMAPQGTVKFTLSIYLAPKIFKYSTAI